LISCRLDKKCFLKLSGFPKVQECQIFFISPLGRGSTAAERPVEGWRVYDEDSFCRRIELRELKRLNLFG
jgi:hypothetical protein